MRQLESKGQSMENSPSAITSPRGLLLVLLVGALLVGLPVAVWFDLRNLTEAALLRQARDLNSVVTSMRAYYGSNVVARILESPGSTQVTHNYETIPGAIPIPATLSIELGRVISEQQRNIAFPFKNRAPHSLDDFEANALAALRHDPNQQLTDVSSSMFNDRVRLIAPVVMGAVCVNCHNAHPESPKRDWKVGDVRGIQEIAIGQAIPSNIFSFKSLLAYFILVAVVGSTFIAVQRRQAATIHGMNRELETANQFLTTLSTKISRYLSPQIYKSIF